MTEEELRPVLAQYGLLPESTGVVARPRISKADRRVVARLKRRYATELANAKIARTDALNITRGVDRMPIIRELLDEGHNAPALLLTFNNEQLVLLWAWRDAVVGGRGSTASENVKGRGSTAQRNGKPAPKRERKRTGDVDPAAGPAR
jgi:hypothetical protein